MKQTHATAERLVFAYRPMRELILAGVATLGFAIVAAVMFGQGMDAGVLFAVFAVSGPVYVFFFVESRAIEFDRGAGTVTLRKRGMRGPDERVVPLAEVLRAEVHRATPDPAARVVPAGEAPASLPVRPVLFCGGDQVVPLTEGYAAAPMAFDMVAAINDWLAA